MELSIRILSAQRVSEWAETSGWTNENRGVCRKTPLFLSY
jgi:hypothetical protein